jgi:hypothetical protein
MQVSQLLRWQTWKNIPHFKKIAMIFATTLGRKTERRKTKDEEPRTKAYSIAAGHLTVRG